MHLNLWSIKYIDYLYFNFTYEVLYGWIAQGHTSSNLLKCTLDIEYLTKYPCL